MARELVGLRVDVIATIGADATLAARNATGVIPIVMLSAGDPVGSGLVASLANPGGNVTGLSMSGPQIEAKRLEILKEALPGLRRVGLLADPGTSIFGYWPESLEQASRSLDMQLIVAEIHALEELDRALASIVRQGGQAVVIHSDVLFWRRPEQVMASVMKYRLPAAVEGRPLLDAGGLVSYEADEEEQLARFATFVDRILRGSRAADLPVEQPKKFRMMVNLKTAASLGLTVPRSLILRADTVLS